MSRGAWPWVAFLAGWPQGLSRHKNSLASPQLPAQGLRDPDRPVPGSGLAVLPFQAEQKAKHQPAGPWGLGGGHCPLTAWTFLQPLELKRFKSSHCLEDKDSPRESAGAGSGYLIPPGAGISVGLMEDFAGL